MLPSDKRAEYKVHGYTLDQIEDSLFRWFGGHPDSFIIGTTRRAAVRAYQPPGQKQHEADMFADEVTLEKETPTTRLYLVRQLPFSDYGREAALLAELIMANQQGAEVRIIIRYPRVNDRIYNVLKPWVDSLATPELTEEDARWLEIFKLVESSGNKREALVRLHISKTDYYRRRRSYLKRGYQIGG